MKLHYIVSEHKEGSRIISLTDRRVVKIAVSEMVAVPCEGSKCPFCQERLSPQNATVDAADSDAVPEKYGSATITTTQKGETVTIKLKKAVG